MSGKCLDIITQITVELHKDDDTKQKLGSGVLYTNRKLSGLVYLLTAKHCLSGLAAKEKVSLRIYNPCSGGYEYVTPVKQSVLLHPVDDAGIVIFNQRELTSVVSNLPTVFVVDKNVGGTKPCPRGSLGQLLIRPTRMESLPWQ